MEQASKQARGSQTTRYHVKRDASSMIATGRQFALLLVVDGVFVHAQYTALLAPSRVGLHYGILTVGQRYLSAHGPLVVCGDGDDDDDGGWDGRWLVTVDGRW